MGGFILSKLRSKPKQRATPPKQQNTNNNIDGNQKAEKHAVANSEDIPANGTTSSGCQKVEVSESRDDHVDDAATVDGSTSCGNYSACETICIKNVSWRRTKPATISIRGGNKKSETGSNATGGEATKDCKEAINSLKKRDKLVE
mmetsp:Transcript_10895/g.23064  ORF Transcript_10895/g.23064 Transcript_10895/m.23064 type:complete len:145 (+) Transcript_10895:97-531(+)|eukprot:CAMPEP_0171347408 /NCGR_PEP_ID=MMETSP0878-20121228/27789_1 /TAXON_ID=67004 /ORGANISM="Thalassiosira weissflogii, Strain CCMP1336" /LENGTH=144 /DNA_ID=CAMNT_0011851443 /DNA_START=66 /DNA_END=500 /DNA_ORIENTATION=-